MQADISVGQSTLGFTMTNTQVMLTINQQSKAIPYPAASHADSQNFGFRVLKGKPDKIENVQEAKDSKCIQEILRILNTAESPFFSVGCEKSFNQGPDGFWAKGYIEFAFNYGKAISDATHYFSLFFHFSREASEYLAQHDIQFWWELQPANFITAKCTGFSCCVWITTRNFSSAVKAKIEWESAVALLSTFLRAVKQLDAEPIY